MAEIVMGSVLQKIAGLLSEQYTKHKKMQTEVAFLKDELGSMNALIRELADSEEELDRQTKEWRNQVMDMAFDIEDCIDEFTHQVGKNSNSGDAGFIGRIEQYVNQLRASYSFSNQIQQLKTRIKDVNDRRKRYKLDVPSSSSSHVAIDPRVTALFVDSANIVGLEGPKEEVTMLLGDEQVKSLRVVSIVGFGGLGKTTLANEVYGNVGRQYDCKAFVSVSQKPDTMKLLNMIISKVGMPQPICIYEVQDLISSLKEYLADKRYFLVIDDIWDEKAWEILRCAFPDNKTSSKVITTTRIESVAKASCNYKNEFVYRIKPLDDPNSKKLFFSRVGNVCLQDFKEISDEILEKCGGLPLAITSIASLLASQPTTSIEQWKYVCQSLSSNLRTNPTLEGMRQVLKLSYNNLPHHLKACLLFIGIYPEDKVIYKRDVVRLWLVEGLVIAIDGMDMKDVASGYFNELINRNMIQPWGPYSYSDEVYSCKVHDMVLDLIRLKSEEENFVRAVDSVQGMTIALQRRVRRLSLHFDYGANQNIDAVVSITGMSHIRSLAIFSMPPSSVLRASWFKSIRVLFADLRGVPFQADLTAISSLVQMEYLEITGKAQLPAQIGTLQCLEVLDLYDANDISLPLDVSYLPCMLHLRVPRGTSLPDGIQKMKSLRTLGGFDAGLSSLENLRGLGELINLRDLSLSCYGVKDALRQQQGTIHVLWSSISKLITCELITCFLRYDPFADPIPVDLEHLDTLQNEGNLEELNIFQWMFPRVPIWMGQHHRLHSLKFTVKTLIGEDIGLLAGLPNLVELWLRIWKSPRERITIRGCSAKFLVLRRFELYCYAPCLDFEAGAMPNLQKFGLYVHADGVQRNGPSTVEGLEHLLSLKRFVADIQFKESYTDPSYTRATAANAMATLRKAIEVHPGHPKIDISNNKYSLRFTM